MKKPKFIKGTLPKGFKPDFESFLFNDEQHRLLQSPTGWQSFSLIREDKKKILASIHFCLANKMAKSPCSAPFGSLSFSRSLQPRDVYEFLKRVETELRLLEIRTIQIKNPPEVYAPFSSALLEVLLFNLGYRILDAEISTTIAIQESNYEAKLEGWELRKLKQGKKAKLVFHELPASRLVEVYNFIRTCRDERGQSLSMSLGELVKTSKAFPDSFLLFGVYQGKDLAAASISIRVSKKIIYNFYSAHPKKFDSLSPVVSLMKGIYGWSFKKNIELIDLGTSAWEGQPNFGLLDFKLRLSGTPSTKFTFLKELK